MNQLPHERLAAEMRRTDPDYQPLTRDEATMMQRHDNNDFPDDQERLTHTQTVDLLNGWAKRAKASS